MRAFSMDLRERVVAACDEGGATREQVAARFSVSVRWVRDLLKRRRDTGSIAPKPRGGGRPPASGAAAAPGPRAPVGAAAAPTLEELGRAAGVACSAPAVYRARVRLGITRKKSPGGRPSRTGRS